MQWNSFLRTRHATNTKRSMNANDTPPPPLCARWIRASSAFLMLVRLYLFLCYGSAAYRHIPLVFFKRPPTVLNKGASPLQNMKQQALSFVYRAKRRNDFAQKNASKRRQASPKKLALLISFCRCSYCWMLRTKMPVLKKDCPCRRSRIHGSPRATSSMSFKCQRGQSLLAPILAHYWHRRAR